VAQLQPNPSGVTTILLVAAVAGGAWLIWGGKKAETKTTDPTLPAPQTPSTKLPQEPPQQPSQVLCEVTQVAVDKWATENGLFVVWADKTTTAPPNLEGVKQAIPETASWSGSKIVAVTHAGNRFWSYGTDGNPILSEALRNQFCSWKKLQPINGVYASIW
jgi:hypothetical protein